VAGAAAAAKKASCRHLLLKGSGNLALPAAVGRKSTHWKLQLPQHPADPAPSAAHAPVEVTQCNANRYVILQVAGAAAAAKKDSWRDLPVEKRIAHALVKGIDEFAVVDTEEARVCGKYTKPLQVIEGCALFAAPLAPFQLI